MAKQKKTSTDVQKESDVAFQIYCNAYKLPASTREFQFMKGRRFRFDYAFIDKKIAVEVEGGIWIQGRHTRGLGYLKDMEKYNLATLEGWRVLRFTPQQLKQEQTYLMLLELFKRS